MSETRDIGIVRSVVASDRQANGSADAPSDTTSSSILKPDIQSMHVISNVKSRYATTVISSKVANPANFSQEVFFSVIIPDAAFISEFSMEIEGKVYKASVKEKEVAKQEYQHAVSQGVAAATVAISARDSNRFTVNVNVEPLSKATFNLTYEELLTRDLDVYNLKVNLHPGQIVDDLSIDVFIDELRPIKVIRTPKMTRGNDVPADENTESNSFATVEYTNEQKTSAHVKFSPTKSQQKEIAEMLKTDDDIISGQFVVQYDVKRDPQGGEVIIYDGYFVHFFAPEDLEPLNKHVIFVLDVSGSMSWGNKINQLKQAMNTILSDLKSGDYFSIVEFSSRVKVWNLEKADERTQIFGNCAYIDGSNINLLPKAYAAQRDTVNKAKELVNYMSAGGGTNIFDALKIALRICKKGIEIDQTAVVEGSDRHSTPNVEPMIVFLTDGDPTVGNTNLQSIQIMVSEENCNENTDKLAALYTLAFGEDADRTFLKKLSLNNVGFMRHIYEAADAAHQLQHFYKQISSPLLKDVKFVYPPDQIEKETVTKHQFRNLFSGSELVVAGKLIQQQEPVTFSEEPVISNSFGVVQRFRPLILPIPKETDKGPSLERLWAYLTIKQLLDQKEIEINPKVGPVIATRTGTPLTTESTDEKNVTDPKKQALELALKYQFVTPLTSLVVVKPNATASVDTESASTSKPRPQFPGSSTPTLFGGTRSTVFRSSPAVGASASFFGSQQQQQCGGLFGSAPVNLSLGRTTTPQSPFVNTPVGTSSHLFNTPSRIAGFGMTNTGFGGIGTQTSQAAGLNFTQNKPAFSLPTSNARGFGEFSQTTQHQASNACTGLKATSAPTFDTTATPLSLFRYEGLNTSSSTMIKPVGSELPKHTNTIHQQLMACSTQFPVRDIFKGLSPSNTAIPEVTNPAPINYVFDDQLKTSPSLSNKITLMAEPAIKKKTLFGGLEEYDSSIADNIYENIRNPRRLILRKKGDSIENEIEHEENKESNSSQTKSNRNDTVDSPKAVDLRGSDWLKKSMQEMSESEETITSPKQLRIDNTIGTSTGVANSTPNLDQDVGDKSINESSFVQNLGELENMHRGEGDQLETPVKKYRHGIINSRFDYYTIPSIENLEAMVSEDGTCNVSGFTIGRKGYGHVYFYDVFDVANLDIDSNVFFRHRELIIYPENVDKPPVGAGLNRRAQITLEKVWPTDVNTGDPITDPKKLDELDYETVLRKACHKFGTQFVEYRPETGSWVFVVQHFTRYGLTETEEDELDL